MESVIENISNRLQNYKHVYKGVNVNGIVYYIIKRDDNKRDVYIEDQTYIGTFDFSDNKQTEELLKIIRDYKLCFMCDIPYYDPYLNNKCLGCEIIYANKILKAKKEELLTCSICDFIFLEKDFKILNCCDNKICTECCSRLIDDNSNCYFCRSSDYDIEWL